MAKNVRFYKKLLALATAAVLVAGFPMSVNATEAGGFGGESEAVESMDEEPVADDEADTDNETDADAEGITDAETGENAEVEAENGSDETAAGEETSVINPDTEEGTDVAESDSALNDTDLAQEAPDSENTDGRETSDVLEREHPAGIIMIDPDPENAVTSEETADASGILKITTVKRPQNVISMVVPVLGAINYNFVMDPEGLLSLNPNNNLVGGESSLYFIQDDERTYSVLADIATAVNKSTVPVILEVELNVNNATDSDLVLTDLSGVYSADENPSLCFAILPTEIMTMAEGDSIPDLPVLKSDMVMIDGQGHAYKEMVLPGSPDNFNLETLITDEDDVYIQEYVPKDDAQWSVAGFTLYGACSRETDWTNVYNSLQDGGRITFTITYRMTPVIEEDEEINE